MELKELISAFSEKIGLGGLEVKDGSCSMEIDGIPMEIVETLDGKNLVVSAIIGPPPLEKADVFMELLLKANVESFGLQAIAFGMLGDSGDLVLQWRLLTQDLDLDSFCSGLETFINKVEQWRQALEDFRPIAEDAVMQDEDTPPMVGLANSNFISV